MSNSYTLILPFVAASTKKFVKATAMREALSLALVSGEPLIMFGPGGYAKSELTRAVLGCIEGADTLIQVFHGKMGEDDLFGGIDLKAINDQENPRILYNIENSFLLADIFLAEEMLDAPARVLTALKGTFTEKCFENGRQRGEMMTKVIIALTNKRPADVIDVADEADRNSIAALMERFALHVTVEWDSHLAADFLEMFEAIETQGDCPEFSFANLLDLQHFCEQVQIPEGVKMVLAELIAEAHKAGNQISPRTAVKALNLIRASAVINNRLEAVEADIISCKYLPAMAGIAKEIAEKVKAASGRAFAKDMIDDGWRIFYAIKGQTEQSEASLIDLLKFAALLERLTDEVSAIKAPTELTSNKDALLKSLQELFTSLGGGAGKAYLSLQVELPKRMIGTGYEVELPQSGNKTLREQREPRNRRSFGRVEDDEEEEQSVPPTNSGGLFGRR